MVRDNNRFLMREPGKNGSYCKRCIVVWVASRWAVGLFSEWLELQNSECHELNGKTFLQKDISG